MDNHRLLFSLFIIAISSLNGFSQSISKELNFYAFLINQNYLSEAKELENSWHYQHKEILLNDSFFYLKANFYIKQKMVDSAAIYFSKPKKESLLYSKSHLNAAFYFSLAKNYHNARQTLEYFEPANTIESELQNFQLASVALLQNDIALCNKHLSMADTGIFLTNQAYRKLSFLKSEQENYREKSPFLAGAFSAVIPGSGKYYAGKKGEAVSVLVSVLALGAVFYENASKYGLTHYRSIATGGIFSIFYIGNIAGSYHSVNRSKKDFHEKLDNNILYHMQHSISSAF